jgi:hypothetical protein
MTLFRLQNMVVKGIQAGADIGAAFGDDLYMTVGNKRFSVFNIFENAPGDEGGGFLPGEIGSALDGDGTLFNDSVTISFFDKTILSLME